MLTTLAEANRTNVLVLPATFCAEADRMASLARSVRHLADRMTLQWRPGLGAGN